MRRKSLRSLLQIILLGVLLGTASSAYADAINSITFNNFSIATQGGNPITFDTWQGTISGMANLGGVSVNDTRTTSGGTVQLFATTPLVSPFGVSFARGSAQVDAGNVTANAFGQAHPNGCTCSGSGTGQFVLSNTFIITGGTGSVGVNISLNVSTAQTLALDEFDLLGTAEYMFDLTVDGTPVFTVGALLSNATPNSFRDIRSSENLFRTITLQLNSPHTIMIIGRARASASAEIPEPATLLLLGSGLGFMGGVARKRRSSISQR